MPAKLLDGVRDPEAEYGFGAMAIRIDTASMVVVTEVPEEAGFKGVNVSEVEDGGEGLVLMAAGTIPLDRLWLLRGETPWSVDRVAECMVRGAFGGEAGPAMIEGFKEIFERNAGRPAVMA